MITVTPSIKTAREHDCIREAGRIVAGALAVAKGMMEPGMRAERIDREVALYISGEGGTPANYEIEGYAYATSVSRWNEIAHALPLPNKIIRRGDIVCVDVAVQKEGCYADGALTFPIEPVHPHVLHLMTTCRRALDEGLAVLREGVLLSRFGETVERVAREEGVSVVRELTGHGIGRAYHEPPHVYNFYHNDNNITLRRGMVFAFEPLFNLGSGVLESGKDGWTIQTYDGNPSAHFEHTAIITKTGVDVVTRCL